MGLLGIEPIYLEHYPNEELDDKYKLCPVLEDTSPAWEFVANLDSCNCSKSSPY